MIKNTDTRRPSALTEGNVIVTYPDPYHPELLGQPGRWTVTDDPYIAPGGKVVIDYRTPEGVEGVFALDPDIEVTIEAATTVEKAEAI